ncbi:hypothetical protein ACVGWL_00350, partial [Enterobacter asburiae]
ATIKNAETAPEGVVFFLIHGLPPPNLKLHPGATRKQKTALIFIKVGELAKTPRSFSYKKIPSHHTTRHILYSVIFL